MKIFRLRSYSDYLDHANAGADSLKIHNEFLAKVTPGGRQPFRVPGYSYTAGKQVDFHVDYEHSGGGAVNWRERVSCPETHFNNRMRATFHLFDIEMGAYRNSDIYITEQVTPIYRYFSEKFSNVVGSEFLGGAITAGTINANGIRNENLCNLSFMNETFDIVVSLDVLEHIPSYEKAFSECARVIRPFGKMMWSVPFVPSSSKNLVRAKMINGEVSHILPPEYHGDPLSGDGVLCFQHFGWEMLDQIRAAGFRDAYALCYHSMEFGYLGGEQFIFVAEK